MFSAFTFALIKCKFWSKHPCFLYFRKFLHRHSCNDLLKNYSTFRHKRFELVWNSLVLTYTNRCLAVPIPCCIDINSRKIRPNFTKRDLSRRSCYEHVAFFTKIEWRIGAFGLVATDGWVQNYNIPVVQSDRILHTAT